MMIELLVRAMPTRIIAIHGAVTNAAIWLPLQHEFGEIADFIAPDLSGHGTQRDIPFQLEASVGLIETLATKDRQADQPTLLLGESLGGYLAILAGARLGDQIDGIIVSGASLTMKGFALTLATLTNLPLQIAQMLVGRESMERLFSWLLHKLTDESTATEIVSRGLNLASRSQSLHALQGVEIHTALKSLRCPIYFINGSLDLPGTWNTKSFASYAREGYAVSIPGGWYTCMLTHPQEIAEVIHTAIIRINRKRANKLMLQSKSQ